MLIFFLIIIVFRYNFNHIQQFISVSKVHVIKSVLLINKRRSIRLFVSLGSVYVVHVEYNVIIVTRPVTVANK